MQRLLQHIRRVVLQTSATEGSDRTLLERFLQAHDEAAFSVLVHRHGPMVFGVCRRVIGNSEDAEDAFQATFMVLVRKAASIHRRDSLGPWLYGVAYRTAQELRRKRARRQHVEVQLDSMPHPAVEYDMNRDELSAHLDDELQKLPEKYRTVLVLCDLQSHTRKDAASMLGIPEGTLSSRLSAAREKLAQRMAKHIPALSVPALIVAMSEAKAATPLPAGLAHATMESAMALLSSGTAAGAMSPTVANLYERVLLNLRWEKMRRLTAYAAVVFALGTVMTLTYVARGTGQAATGGGLQANVQADKQAPEQQTRRDLRYDGKLFEDWRSVLFSELKTERQREAIKAMLAFGIYDYGRESSEALLDFIRQYRSLSDWTWMTREEPTLVEVKNALVKIGQAALPVVQKAVSDDDVKVRRIAVEVLGGISPPSKKVLASVLNAMKDEDPGVRYRAVEVLGRAEPKSVVKLMTIAIQDKQPNIRNLAVEKISYHVYDDPSTVLTLLVRAMADPDSQVRGQAVSQLNQLNQFPGGPQFAGGMGRPGSPGMGGFMPGGRFGSGGGPGGPGGYSGSGGPSGSAAELKVDPKIIVPAILKVIEKGYPESLRFAITMLRNYPSEAESTVPVLMSAYDKSNEWGVHFDVIETLGWFGPPAKAALPLLRRAASESTDSNIQQSAANAIRRIVAADKKE